MLHQLETDLLKARAIDGESNSGFGDSFSQPSSLFGEIHLTEIKKLEKNLEQVENEKNRISSKLFETESQSEQLKKELFSQKGKFNQALASIRKFVQGHLKFDTAKTSDEEGEVGDESDQTSCEDVCEIEQMIRELFNTCTVGKLQSQLVSLREALDAKELHCERYEQDLNTLSRLAEESQSGFCCTQDDLALVTEELAAIYYQLCDANGETPSRVLLEHASNKPDARLTKLEELRQQLSPENAGRLLQNWRVASGETGPRDSIEILKEQLKHLKSAVDALLECHTARAQVSTATAVAPITVNVAPTINTLKVMGSTGGIGHSPSLQAISEHVPLVGTDLGTASTNDVKLLIEQNMRYKALISTKREQVATLRTVLKANKQTAEVALANLKSKYESEKQLVTETMAKLRTELKALKEDAATFASLRSMFAARCEEYVAQNDELQRQIQSSEDEKKTLNSLLRIAIQQKLALTQKLEEYEMDRERMYPASGSGSGGSTQGTGHVGGPPGSGLAGIQGGMTNGLLRPRGGRLQPGSNPINQQTGNGSANAFVRNLSRIGPLGNNGGLNSRGQPNLMNPNVQNSPKRNFN